MLLYHVFGREIRKIKRCTFCSEHNKSIILINNYKWWPVNRLLNTLELITKK